MNVRTRIRAVTIGWVATDMHCLAGHVHLGVDPLGRYVEWAVHEMMRGVLAYALGVVGD